LWAVVIAIVKAGTFVSSLYFSVRSLDNNFCSLCKI
jgi:hypothetical protein